MSRNDWTKLLVKLFALLQFVSVGTVLILFVGVLDLIKASDILNDMQVSVPLAGYFLGSILFPIVIGAFLWINASTISVWIWGKELSKRVKNEKKPNLFQVKKAIIAGLGLYIFVTTLPSWINSFGKIYADWLMASSIPDTSIMTMFQVQDYVRWFALIVQFLISILFIASPARILAFLDKAQRTWDLIT